MGRGRRAALAWAATATALLVMGAVIHAPAAHAGGGFRTGLLDPLLWDSTTSTRTLWQDRAKAANADMLRLIVSWRAIATAEPDDPTNPGDPAYDFTALDTAVRDAAARGMHVLLTVNRAPDWAERPGRPAWARPGTWKPRPEEFGEFAQAVATRYSGAYPGEGGVGALPSVRYYEAFNEPNLGDPKGDATVVGSYLNPQYEGGRSTAPRIYARLLRAFYKGVHAVRASNRVIGPGLSPYGDDDRDGHRTRPVAFLRRMFCLSGRKRLKPLKRCPVRPKLDIVSHHPFNTTGGATGNALDPDDASSGDLRRIKRVVRKAEKVGNVRGGPKRHPLWVTEFGWPSRPPAPWAPSLKKQARWVQQAMYVYWRRGARVAIHLRIRDPDDEGLFFQSGLYFRDGSAKPALTAFRFPFVASRKSRRKVRVWGKAPASGKLRIQRKRGRGWRTLKRIRVREGRVFNARVRLRGKARLRGRVGGQTSLVWDQRR